MISFKKSNTLSKHIQQLKQRGLSIGFVPTMGALHLGHISLIEESNKTCDITICSIFVNPTQFNDPSDFAKYPVTIGNDILLLENAKCDVLFFPHLTEVYPGGIAATAHYPIGEIEFILEGKFRPHHFQGVCQVVDRLLNIVMPHKLFIGQKDYQQCKVIKKLIDLLQLDIDVVTVNTYRENSGLALSSRNLRLNDEQIKSAATISEAMMFVKRNIMTSPFRTLEEDATKFLLESGFNKVDYVLIADPTTLRPADNIGSNSKLIVLVAAFIADIRLIDNIEITL